MRGICSGPRTESRPWAARSAAAARLGEAGQGLSHQTGQESRSTGHRAGRSVTVITAKHQRRQGMKAHASLEKDVNKDKKKQRGIS
jgi:hypothetical protein